MTKILTWEHPPRAVPVEEWKAYEADSAPPGTYQPNMSETWKKRWKAKMRGQHSNCLYDLRVEIRKTVTGTGYDCAQVLIVVWLYASPDSTAPGAVKMSMNGTAWWSETEFAQLAPAVAEAREAMQAYASEHPKEAAS